MIAELRIGAIVASVQAHGKLTGSRALWGHRPDSDYDYMMLQADYDRIVTAMEEINWPVDPLNGYDCSNGCYFAYEGKTFNLIRLSKDEFKLWKLARDIMRELPEVTKVLLKERDQRKAVYRGLVDLFRENISKGEKV